MIIFDKVKYKNFLATGADFNTFELNSSKSNIITGKNGTGKCVDKFTEIDITFLDNDAKKAFEEFIRGML